MVLFVLYFFVLAARSNAWRSRSFCTTALPSIFRFIPQDDCSAHTQLSHTWRTLDRKNPLPTRNVEFIDLQSVYTIPGRCTPLYVTSRTKPPFTAYRPSWICGKEPIWSEGGHLTVWCRVWSEVIVTTLSLSQTSYLTQGYWTGRGATIVACSWWLTRSIWYWRYDAIL